MVSPLPTQNLLPALGPSPPLSTKPPDDATVRNTLRAPPFSLTAGGAYKALRRAKRQVAKAAASSTDDASAAELRRRSLPDTAHSAVQDEETVSLPPQAQLRELKKAARDDAPPKHASSVVVNKTVLPLHLIIM